MAGNDEGEYFASDCMGQFRENVSSDRRLSHDSEDDNEDDSKDCSKYEIQEDIDNDDDCDYDYSEDHFDYPMSRLTFNVVETETYIVLVAGYDGSEGEFTLSAECSDT